jgi:hypothetical protein
MRLIRQLIQLWLTCPNILVNYEVLWSLAHRGISAGGLTDAWVYPEVKKDARQWFPDFESTWHD